MASNNPLQKISAFMGMEANTTSQREKLISGLGGVIGIYAIIQVTGLFVSGIAVPLIVASMGASAVLLFAVPHGKLSQPWNLLSGHILSAIVGVSCARWVADPALAAAMAVGIAITIMHYSFSIHPPGGATALMAVIGGPEIHALGYTYVLTPVLLNVLVILLIAVLFNLPFVWRRYPASLAAAARQSDKQTAPPHIGQSDLKYALQKLDCIMDVTEADLEALFELAENHSQSNHLSIEDIQVGHYYSNGHLGSFWSVRQVIDGPDDSIKDEDRMIYKTVAGYGLHQTGTATRDDLARWSRYEVMKQTDGWSRVQNN